MGIGALTTLTIKIVSMALGILFNLLVIVVRAFKLYHRRKISSYHFIILQVALADFFFATLIIIDIETDFHEFQWLYSLSACKAVKSAQGITAAVPAFFMLLLAFERYQGISNALKHRWTIRSIAVVALIVWIYTILSFVPFIISLGLYKENYTDPQNVTNMKFWCVQNNHPSDMFKNVYQNYIAITYLVFPLMLTTFFHMRIYIFVRKHAKQMSVHRQGTTTTSRGWGSSTGGDSKDSESSDNKASLEDGLDFDRFQCGTIDEVDDEVFKTRKSTVKSRVKQTFSRMFNRNRRNKVSRKNRPKERKLKIHILLAISVCFFVCTFPNQLWFCFHSFGIFEGNSTTGRNIHRVFSCLVYIHCFVNGIIYSIMDKKFRRDAFLIFKSLVTMKPYFRHEFPTVYSTRTRSIQLSSMS